MGQIVECKMVAISSRVDLFIPSPLIEMVLMSQRICSPSTKIVDTRISLCPSWKIAPIEKLESKHFYLYFYQFTLYIFPICHPLFFFSPQQFHYVQTEYTNFAVAEMSEFYALILIKTDRHSSNFW